MKSKLLTLLLLSQTFFALSLFAQEEEEQEAVRIPHSSQSLTAGTKADRQVPFAYNGSGPEYLINWGMDTAWDDVGNVRRGTAFIGKENISYGRISFQPNDLVGEDLQLSNEQKNRLRSRVNHIKLSGTTEVMINCDHEALNDRGGISNYKGKPVNWYRLIKASVRYAETLGVKVVSIAPFNEPDYTNWNEGSKDDFKAIAKLIKEDEELAHIRISAGNTLNDDRAWEWYDYMKPYVNEGNTHQLAGSFDNYANFFTRVREDGNFATADELHNVMEAIVGVEYGLQGGIWWGYDGVARGDFCKATSPGGMRLGYNENRSAWSAACVYRLPNGKVEAFLGTSERQANTSTYEFVATDRDVYFDGYGPTRTFFMSMPGGTGYSTGQANAERMIRIQTGDDVPPYPIENGTYVIMNKASRKAIGVANGNVGSGVKVTHQSYSPTRPATSSQWQLEWVSDRVGGDFSYFYLKNNGNPNFLIDVNNWSLDANGQMILYSGSKGANEQWYIEYVGDGDYVIRSRHSALCLEIAASALTTNGAVLRQGEWAGEDRQRWRFLPIDATMKVEKPATPTGLTATPQTASVLLSWDATDADIDGYMILRVAQDGPTAGEWQVIARMVTGTQFIDNSCVQGYNYSYKIKAIDHSCNMSEASAEVSAAPTAEKGLIARYDFEDNLYDDTDNEFDIAMAGKTTYSVIRRYVKSGDKALSLNGNDNYLLLPNALGNQRELTIAAWVYWSGANNWERIFDFGNGTTQYMFFTPSNGSEARFVLKNEGDEQILSADKFPSGTTAHLAITLGEDGAKIYINGELKAESTDLTIRPSDFAPALCYIGRSQFSADKNFKGYIDDLRIYNYALDAEEIDKIINPEETDGIATVDASASKAVATEYYTVSGARTASAQKGLTIVKTRNADGSVTIRKMLK